MEGLGPRLTDTELDNDGRGAIRVPFWFGGYPETHRNGDRAIRIDHRPAPGLGIDELVMGEEFGRDVGKPMCELLGRAGASRNEPAIKTKWIDLRLRFGV